MCVSLAKLFTGTKLESNQTQHLPLFIIHTHTHPFASALIYHSDHHLQLLLGAADVNVQLVVVLQRPLQVGASFTALT